MRLRSLMDDNHFVEDVSKSKEYISGTFERTENSEIICENGNQMKLELHSSQDIPLFERRNLKISPIATSLKNNFHLNLAKNSPLTHSGKEEIIEETVISEKDKMAPNPRTDKDGSLSARHASIASSDYTQSDSDDNEYACAIENRLINHDRPRRSLKEIKSSLENKVIRLREGKHIIDRKLQLSKEEENLMSQDRVKQCYYIVQHRKERLKRIIDELRHKLQDQGKRLQSNYNTILAIQRNVLRCRSFTMKRKFLTDSPIRESPF